MLSFSLLWLAFSGVVTFNPDTFTSCIVVPVTNNEIALEENQELRLAIAPPTQLPAVLLGARQEALVVVADNDGKDTEDLRKSYIKSLLVHCSSPAILRRH